MADNVQLPATGTGTADVVVATDDIAGVHFQEVKLFESTLGSTTPTGVTANPLQVALPAATVTTLTPPAAITGFATSAKQLPDGHTVALSATDNAVLDTIDAAIDAINAKMVTGTDIGDVTINNSTGAAAVNIQDGGNTITVDGAVTVTNATAANLKAEVTIAAAQTLTTVTTVGTVTTCNLAAETTKVIGTVRTASGGIASGSIASGAVASGAIASGAVASGAIATGAIVDALADDAAFTPATSRVFPMGAFADETSPDSVTEGDIGAPRMTLDRLLCVTDRPSATGEGLDTFFSIDLDESEEEIKATAGKIYGWYIFNAHTATLYVRFYNATAANTTVGTTAALMVLPIPAGAAANVHFNKGITFSTALCAAATTGIAANDTGAPGANMITINVFYK